jgi:hypothetical protein
MQLIMALGGVRGFGPHGPVYYKLFQHEYTSMN